MTVTSAQLSLGSERHAYLVFDYLSCALSAMRFEDWAESDNLVARLNLPNMQWRADQKIDVYAQAVRGLFALEPDSDKYSKYFDFIDIYSGLTDNERARYAREYPQRTQPWRVLQNDFAQKAWNKVGALKHERCSSDNCNVASARPPPTLLPGWKTPLTRSSNTGLTAYSTPERCVMSLIEVRTSVP